MVMAQALYQAAAERDAATAKFTSSRRPGRCRCSSGCPRSRAASSSPSGTASSVSRRRWQLGRRLRAERYTRRSCCRVPRKPRSCRGSREIPLRTGFRGEWRYGLLNDVRGARSAARSDRKALRRSRPAARRGPAERARGVAAAAAQSMRRNLERLRRERTTSTPGAHSSALMPGAEYGPAKRWPSDNSAQLAARARGRGRRRHRARLGQGAVARRRDRGAGRERARAQPLRRDDARGRRRSLGGGRRGREQRLGPDARRGGGRRARRRDLRLVLAELHAAADRREDRLLARPRVQPVLRSASARLSTCAACSDIGVGRRASARSTRLKRAAGACPASRSMHAAREGR